jgi:cytochrome P450/NADPH-cytochrome P450 reductase
VVTASYNGQAPANTHAFEELATRGAFAANILTPIRYAALGCGNTQWATYQEFPKRVEAALLAAGAEPILPRGEVDAAGDFDGMATT